MEHHVIVTSPDGVHFAGPVEQPKPDTMRQDLFESPVILPTEDAQSAFHWALGDAQDWETQSGVHAQVWHVIDGIVTEYGTTNLVP